VGALPPLSCPVGVAVQAGPEGDLLANKNASVSRYGVLRPDDFIPCRLISTSGGMVIMNNPSSNR
jgi:hypothetical protein